jgi:hypothetical protein
MFQYKKTNAKGSETTPEFYNDMPFNFPVEVIFVDLKDGKAEQIEPAYISGGPEDLKLVRQLMRLCEDQSWLIQYRENKIKDLQNQLADYEQEIYGLDLQVYQLRRTGNPEDQTTSAWRIRAEDN